MCIVFISLTLKGLEVRCPVHRCILWHKILKSPNIRKDKILKSPNFYNVYYGLLYLPYKLQIKNNGRSWIIPTFASNKAPWADCSYWCFNSLSLSCSTVRSVLDHSWHGPRPALCPRIWCWSWSPPSLSTLVCTWYRLGSVLKCKWPQVEHLMNSMAPTFFTSLA